MFRVAVVCYLVIAVAMVGTSLYTGHRATVISGVQHYMLTTTHVLVEDEVPAESAADAAFDAATREGGESTKLWVEKPIFVLGFADATGPAVIGGGLLLGAARLIGRRRRRKAGSGDQTTVDV